MDIVRRGMKFVGREWKTMARFLIVGGSSFAVKAATYVVLSRLLWTEGSRNVENGAAVVVATSVNYLLHRFWTFHNQQPAPGVMRRYLMAVAAGTTADAGLFYVLHSLFGWYDVVALAFTSLSIACCTFTLHRFWTFHEKPRRWSLP